MSFAEALGTIGVSLLLIGFFLNLFGLMKRSTLKYVLLNLFGGGLACTASILIEFFPFVILEGTWTLVALVGLGRLLRARSQAAQA
jgi:hypothetical protein